jgi:hypothetical protein
VFKVCATSWCAPVFLCHPLKGVSSHLAHHKNPTQRQKLPKFPSGLMKPKSNLRAACCAVTAQQWGHWCCTHNRVYRRGCKCIELIGLGAAGCRRMAWCSMMEFDDKNAAQSIYKFDIQKGSQLHFRPRRLCAAGGSPDGLFIQKRNAVHYRVHIWESAQPKSGSQLGICCFPNNNERH